MTEVDLQELWALGHTLGSRALPVYRAAEEIETSRTHIEALTKASLDNAFEIERLRRTVELQRVEIAKLHEKLEAAYDELGAAHLLAEELRKVSQNVGT